MIKKKKIGLVMGLSVALLVVVVICLLAQAPVSYPIGHVNHPLYP